MEFAGNKFIYLSKLKKEKIEKIRKAEEDNKAEAPIPNIEPNDNIKNKLDKYKDKNEKKKNGSVLSDDSDNAYIEVNSNNFNIDLVNSRLGNMNINKNMNIGMNNNMGNYQQGNNQQAAPGLVFKKAVDTNVCVIRYKSIENKSDNLDKLYKCQKCGGYLNKYSSLILKENNKYEWKCEFCSNLNTEIFIENNNIPKSETFEKCIEANIVKETNKDDDSTLIFCFDISGSMFQSYNIGPQLKEKFNKIIGKKSVKRNNLFNKKYKDDNEIDFSNYDFIRSNTNYISRLDMVKLSIENNIKTLLKNSPNIKVGIVSFGSEIEVKGDCLSNVMILKEKDMSNESKIKSLGEENTNLIKSKLKESSSKILESIRKIEENSSTALGPAILMSLSLMKNAKIGSRIFLCTDGMSNLGVGNISENREKAIEFYIKIGNMAKEKE